VILREGFFFWETWNFLREISAILGFCPGDPGSVPALVSGRFFFKNPENDFSWFRKFQNVYKRG
jgi:hypothetical protein